MTFLLSDTQCNEFLLSKAICSYSSGERCHIIFCLTGATTFWYLEPSIASCCSPQRLSSNVFAKVFSQDWDAINMGFIQFCGDVTPHNTTGFMLQHEDVTLDSAVGLKWQSRDDTSLLWTAAGESVLFDGAGLILHEYPLDVPLSGLDITLTAWQVKTCPWELMLINATMTVTTQCA